MATIKIYGSLVDRNSTTGKKKERHSLQTAIQEKKRKEADDYYNRIGYKQAKIHLSSKLQHF